MMSSSSPGSNAGGRPPIWIVVLGLLVLMARLTEAAQNLRHVLADSDSTKTKDKIKPKTSTTNYLVDTEAANSNLVHDDVVEDTSGPISTPIPKNAAAKDTTEKNFRHLAESSNNNDQDVPDDEVELDFMYWVTPLQSLGLTCGGSAIKSRDGEYTCIKAGEALCQDNDGGPFGRWTFGITEDNQVNLWTPKNEIAWTFCTEVSHVCIGEERDPRPDKYSNQRPYLYFYDEKTQRTVGNLTCDGTDGLNDENLDRPTILKMVDNSDVGMYAENEINILKFKKGQTPSPGESNALLNINVTRSGQDTITTISFNDNKCTWSDICSPPSGTSFHSSNPETVLLGIDENGTDVLVSLMGDMVLTYSQAVNDFGQEAADEMKEGGFLFAPEDEDDPLNRAISSSGFSWRVFHNFKGKIVIPYEIDKSSGLSSSMIDLISESLTTMEKASGVLRFLSSNEYNLLPADVRAAISPHFIQFTQKGDFRGGGCWSTVGRKSILCSCISPQCKTCQKVHLQENSCKKKSTIIHEMMHALGFQHEHQRRDRDDYVTFFKSRADVQFFSKDWKRRDRANTLGVGYDFGSIMHYGVKDGRREVPCFQRRDDYTYMQVPATMTEIYRDGTIDANCYVLEPVPGRVPEPFSLPNTDMRLPKEPAFQTDGGFALISYNYPPAIDPLSNRDVLQIQLLFTCLDGGPTSRIRSLSQALEEGWCTLQCPCWENAPYECENDNECQDGLVCSPSRSSLYVRKEPYCRQCVVHKPAFNQFCDYLKGDLCRDQEVQPQPAKICQKCIGGNKGDEIILSVKTRDISNGNSKQSLSLTFFSRTDKIQEFTLPADSLPLRGTRTSFTIPLDNDFGCVESMRIVAGGRDAWMAEEIILYNKGSTGILDPQIEMNIKLLCDGFALRGCGGFDSLGEFWIANDFSAYLGYQFGNCWEISESGFPSKCSIAPPLTPAPSPAPIVTTPTSAPSFAPSSSPTIRNCKVPDGQGQGDFLEGECLNVATCEADGKFAVPYQVGFPDGLQDSCKAEPCDVQCCVESEPPLPPPCVATTGEAGICTSDGGCEGDDVIGLDSESGCENFSNECDTKCCVPSSQCSVDNQCDNGGCCVGGSCISNTANQCVLKALYDATNGDSWDRSDGWDFTSVSDPCSNDPSDWHGISCDNDDITSIDLSQNNLVGSIPTELVLLTNMRIIDFFNNDMTGKIPTELGQLTSVQFLYLGQNDLTGTIPTELSNLLNLWDLHLFTNSLTGGIPTELGGISSLKELDLFQNDLTGKIPTELVQLSGLSLLALSSNDLTGQIPTEFGILSNLSELYFSTNALTGEIPTELGQLTGLSVLGLNTNALRGSIPTQLGQLTNLRSLYLQQNELTGEIPTEFGNILNLQTLYLYVNELTGEIPTELGLLTNLQNLRFSFNNLTGEIPTELGLLTSLIYLYMDGNFFTNNAAGKAVPDVLCTALFEIPPIVFEFYLDDIVGDGEVDNKDECVEAKFAP